MYKWYGVWYGYGVIITVFISIIIWLKEISK